MKITKEEYEEYEKLKAWAKKQKVYDSAKSVTLEEDIDLPIRKSVAMVALLGCQPTFSCCGFDYEGQPFHKSHQYRQPYIRMKQNIFTTQLYMNLNIPLARSGWSFVRSMGDEMILELVISMNPHWNGPNCIHASEECVIGIADLEKHLMTLYDDFKEMAFVYDTNACHHKFLRFWQYPAKEPWRVYKHLLETY